MKLKNLTGKQNNNISDDVFFNYDINKSKESKSIHQMGVFN